MSFPESLVAVVKRRFAEAVPHNRALGVRLVELTADGLVAELPYDARLVGDPQTGVLHGGAITSLIDAACGVAVPVAVRRPIAIATLDLRIDYLKAAPPRQSVFCRARCYEITRHVAFVRATADCGDAEDPVAAAAGTFVIIEGGKLPGVPEGP